MERFGLFALGVMVGALAATTALFVDAIIDILDTDSPL